VDNPGKELELASRKVRRVCRWCLDMMVYNIDIGGLL